MKIFISWSGKRSQAVAQALHDWLPSVMQAVVPWMSSEDIQKGSRWLQEIGEKLQENDFGIICLTPENTRSEWILFEAGALSKVIDRASVATVLLDLTNADVTGPLTQFQDTKVEKSDFRKLVATINGKLAVSIAEPKLDEAFELWWPKLESRLVAARRLVQVSHAERGERDILEEILGHVRAYEFARASPALPPDTGLELTRFRGHLRMLEGVHDGKAKTICSGVAGAAGAAGSGRPNARAAGKGVRAVGAGDSELG